MVELPAASGILELQAERRCDVAIDPLRLSAVDRVGQPGMATQSACMLTRTSSALCGQLTPQLSLKKHRISGWGAAFEATPPLAGRRSGKHVKNRPPLCPSTIGNQGPLQRP